MKWICLIIAIHLSVNAAVLTSPTANYADVSNTVFQAAFNDTVIIPAGGVVWSSPLLLYKGINIFGKGSTLTKITNAIPPNPPWDSGTHTPPLFWVAMTNDNNLRISSIGLYCNFTSGGRGVYFGQLDLSGNPALHGFRIDHCFFHQATPRAIDIFGGADGVVDHCVFIDNAICFGMISGDSREWNRFALPYYGLGTTNTPVFEDNYITYTSWAIGQGASPTDCGQGGHYTWRHNVMSNNISASLDGLDLHGNMHYFWQDGWRSSIFFECYSNTFQTVGGNVSRSMNLRGGTCMVFSNSFIGTFDNNKVTLQEEECWGSTFPTNIINWPAQDQITNTFLWGNTVNGVLTDMAVVSDAAPCVVNFIQLNRDYWNHAPNSTNVLKNYVPLVYPHPLVSAEDFPPAPTIVDTLFIGKATASGKVLLK